MTYPADFLTWLEALDSRFNITAGHIWEAAQKAERERICTILYEEYAQINVNLPRIMERIDVPE